MGFFEYVPPKIQDVSSINTESGSTIVLDAEAFKKYVQSTNELINEYQKLKEDAERYRQSMITANYEIRRVNSIIDDMNKKIKDTKFYNELERARDSIPTFELKV